MVDSSSLGTTVDLFHGIAIAICSSSNLAVLCFEMMISRLGV
jgi:hypothetical protein